VAGEFYQLRGSKVLFSVHPHRSAFDSANLAMSGMLISGPSGIVDGRTDYRTGGQRRTNPSGLLRNKSARQMAGCSVKRRRDWRGDIVRHPGSALCSILATMVAVGLSAQVPKPTFEIASVKRRGDQRVPVSPPSPRPPDVFYRTGDTVDMLVQFAYNMRGFQVIGGPDWVRKDRFEVNAKAAGAVPVEQMRPMVQSMLEDRFRLVVRKDQREMPTESLVLARGDGRLGPKLSKREDPASLPPPKPLAIPPGSVPFTGRCREMSAIAATASGVLATSVVDRTGLTGLWSYEFVYAQIQPLPPGVQRALADQANVPSFSTALQEELGLRLESGRGPIEVVVIEAVQQPVEN
jgi:uncharacterized protein (TIGR03435 family)